MSRDPISALDEAIAGLEAELTANPRFVLLQSLKTARAAFPMAQAAAAAPRVIAQPTSEDRPSGRQMSPARTQALALSKEFLKEEGGVIKTKDIYSYVELKDVELPGGANNLASLLGRFPDVFVSHGRQGWSLKAEENEAPNGDAEGASEVGEVAASPVENQPRLSVVG